MSEPFFKYFTGYVVMNQEGKFWDQGLATWRDSPTENSCIFKSEKDAEREWPEIQRTIRDVKIVSVQISVDVEHFPKI